MENPLNITLTAAELNQIISALLFTSSVNVFADIDEKECKEMIETATKLKAISPDIKLEHVEFYIEDSYEEPWSIDILKTFGENIHQVTAQDYFDEA